MKASNRLQLNTALGSKDVIALSKVTGTISELAILDTHWTSNAIKLSSKSNKAELDDLGLVVKTLEDVLVRSQSAFAQVGEVFQANAGRIEEGYAAIKSGKLSGVAPPSKAKIDEFVAFVDTFGGNLAEAAIAASRRLASPERVAGERKMLNDEFSKLSAGGSSDGDLTDEQWGDVHLVAMGAAIILGAEAGVVVEAAAALWELIFG